jgi:hypothetical protein
MEPFPIKLPMFIPKVQEINELVVERAFDDFSSDDPAYWSESSKYQ